MVLDFTKVNDERFKLAVNNNQYDIIDCDESAEKNALCIYNDLGYCNCSSAPSLLALMNVLNNDKEEFKKENDLLKQIMVKMIGQLDVKYSIEEGTIFSVRVFFNSKEFDKIREICKGG